MLNTLWAFMILTGVVYGGFTGNMTYLSNAALDSAKEAVQLCITMLGIMGFWVGMMKIAEKAGLIEGITKALQPFICFMFPKIPKGHKAMKYIAANIVANVLGLGWACTPAGLKAMEALAELESERGNAAYQKDSCKIRYASDEMCIFLILNISSLQLIPVNMIAYRSQYGSVEPARIIVPAILATAVSTGVAIIYCKWKACRHP
ncbi:MAG: nucleoside recognition protein [Lachnospiraceae bacterium]|nr:nucleoside recognition protein [Lachnospiraceae bacterium]